MKDLDQIDAPARTAPLLVTALTRHVLPFMRQNWLPLVTFALLGLIGGTVAIVSLPKQWLGTVVLQVGQISDGVAAQPVPIETTFRALDRLRLPSFQNDVLRSLGLPLEIDTNVNTDLIRKSTQISILRNSDLLQIAVRGYSAQDAKRFTEAYKELLLSAHAQLIQPSIGKLQSDLSVTERSLVIEEARRTELQNLVKEQYRIGVTGKFSEGVLLTDMIDKNDLAIRTLRMRQTSLRELLSPSKTFNTRSLGLTHISERPVFPPKIPLALGGAVLGLLVGVLFGLWNDTRRANLK
ncbi:hypothetical protein D9M69_227030 [compost metagenome]